MGRGFVGEMMSEFAKMPARKPIRLSTMEIVLIGVLLGSLLLGLLQARRDEQRLLREH